MGNNDFVKLEKIKPLSADMGQNEMNDTAEIKEFSVFNQAALIFNRQDKLLTDVHILLYAARNYDPKLSALRDYYHAVRNAMAPARAALHMNDQEKLDRELKKFSKVLGEFDDLKHGHEPSPEEKKKYFELHQMAYEMLEFLYAAQQKINMGVPKEKAFSTRDRIRNAVRE